MSIRSILRTILKRGSPEVLKAGHPALRTKAELVRIEDLQSAAFLRIVKDMNAVFNSPLHPVLGLAAAQIGHPIQLIAYQILDAQLIKEKGLGGPVPRTFIVNPVMSISDKTSPSKWAAEYEFCESLPKYSGLVRRAGHVHVTGLGLDGSTVNINARGFLARILQHEIDHMEGILFVDKMEKHSLRHDDYVDKFEMFKR
ncbi:peptide deformylase [Batrachochytrium salamandrivorans]|nr:peptide deformylase [Batrachochytrium salamandrivorans]